MNFSCFTEGWVHEGPHVFIPEVEGTPETAFENFNFALRLYEIFI